MTETSTHNTVFTEPETLELPDYRPVSKLCLLALALALLSPLALLHPLLLVIPILSIAMAVVALRVIRREQVGRPAAAIAVVVSAFFGTWGPAHYFSWQDHLFDSAETFADQWFEIIKEGRLQEAHHLTYMYLTRVDENTSLDEYYAEPVGERLERQTDDTPVPAVELASFFESSPMKELLVEGGFEYEPTDRLSIHTRNDNSLVLSVIYRVKPSGLEPVDIKLTMERYRSGKTGYWHISDIRRNSDGKSPKDLTAQREYYLNSDG